ncbi:hypothetical protein SAMN05421812_108147 [Asanoa hainanensis]|uniref:Uncharacterized protein n=1 Tax=Asanoa hainanensis TaxID=560556 RepID=A0A239NC99_9ACTN|nr:hypothetical protein [Asanoa hainanensis]SNT52541.1 hypothetical protein SAMN05421812_108147 [Asanoa hainanensis]
MVHARLEKDWTDPAGVAHAAGASVDVDAATLADLQAKGIVAGDVEAQGWIGPTSTGGDVKAQGWIGPTSPPKKTEAEGWIGPTAPPAN